MDSTIYGFLLNDNILYDVAKRKIIYYSLESADYPMFFKVVSLNDTQNRLFVFLLTNRKNGIIDKSDIMESVWDNFSMSSSSQRLWQTINDLRKKLSSVGLPEDFIMNVHGMGYSIDRTKVMSLYVS